jgi:pimeloyl-ACP methyl ester carboxylesterase
MLWIILFAVIGIAAALTVYWTLLNAMFPEQLRTSEIYTITTDDIWQLRLCRYRKGRTEGEPVLFVHGFNSNHHNFTEPEEQCFIDYLVKHGYDCWGIDLRGCASSKPAFERTFSEIRMEDYLDHDLPAVMRFIREHTGYNAIHWIGHSMGGALLYAWALEHGEEHIASGVTLGSPIGFEKAKVKVPFYHIFFGTHFPRLTGNFLRAMVPVVRIFPFLSPFFPVNMRNVPRKMNAGHFINMLEAPPPQVLRQIASFLNTRSWNFEDRELDLAENFAAISLPLLAFIAPRDPFLNSEAIRQRISGMAADDTNVITLSKEEGCDADYNHVDMVCARNGEKEVFEPALKWLQAHPATERLNIYDESNGSGDNRFLPPLEETERNRILSGRSFAHVTELEVDEDEGGEAEAVPAEDETAFPPAEKEEAPAAAEEETETMAEKKTGLPKKKSAPGKKASTKKKRPSKKKASPKKKSAAKKKKAPDDSP